MTAMLKLRLVLTLSLTALLFAAPALAETCTAGPDLDPTTRGSLETTARSVYNMAAKGNVYGLKQNAVSSLASSFGGVEQAVIDNKTKLADGTPTLRGVYFLDASEDKGTVERAEFFCGIFNSNDRTGFVLTNLPAGKYGVAIEDGHGKTPMTLAMVLQVVNGAWKLGGFYVKQSTANGHDGRWYWDQAKQLAAKGQKHSAFFYYLEANELLHPVPFMTDPELDKLAEEVEAATPPDVPLNAPTTLNGPDGKAYRLTAATPLQMPEGLSLLLKQQVPDAGDNGAAFQANMALMKAAVTKWPEIRDIFVSVVARAQDTQGHDYGSLLKMTDIK
jgi:hypothetical protein